MSSAKSSSPSPADPLRQAEAALAKLGFARIPPVARTASSGPEFWVQESGVPRRTFPVFVERGSGAETPRVTEWIEGRPVRGAPAPARAIVVVPSEGDAEHAWQSVRGRGSGAVEAELAVLVLPSAPGKSEAHWHRGILPHGALLRLATGVAVGLFRRAQATEGTAQVDFGEMLEILKGRFQVDVAGSLGAGSDEDALYLLYQLAVRDAYAPGDPGSNLHLLVLKPTGPAARLPWFAA